MSETERVLRGVQACLNAERPDRERALQLIRNLWRRGVCYEETRALNDGSLFLLERVFPSLLVGDQPLASLLEQCAGRLSRSGLLSQEDQQKLQADLTNGLNKTKENLIFPDGRWDVDVTALARALAARGYTGFPRGEAGAPSPSWGEINEFLGKVLAVTWQNRGMSEQEEIRKIEQLQAFVDILIRASSRLDRSIEGLESLKENLRGEARHETLERFSARIAEEIRDLGEKTDQAAEKLAVIQRTSEELERLFHEADALLRETQDSDLMDVVSGLPNRYGLMARINQARLKGHGKKTSPFSTVFIGLADLGRQRRSWDRSRYSALMRWLGGRIRETGSYEMFRTASKGLALFFEETNHEQAMTLAQGIKQTVLDPIIRREEIPQGLHFGVGVVPYRSGMDEEAFFLAGAERMRQSILDGGLPR